jgi:hypothetical protein
VRLRAFYPEGYMIEAMIELVEGADRFCRGKGKAASVSPVVIAGVPEEDRARRLSSHSLTEEYRCVPNRLRARSMVVSRKPRAASARAWRHPERR